MRALKFASVYLGSHWLSIISLLCQQSLGIHPILPPPSNDKRTKSKSSAGADGLRANWKDARKKTLLPPVSKAKGQGRAPSVQDEDEVTVQEGAGAFDDEEDVVNAPAMTSTSSRKVSRSRSITITC